MDISIIYGVLVRRYVIVPVEFPWRNVKHFYKRCFGKNLTRGSCIYWDGCEEADCIHCDTRHHTYFDAENCIRNETRLIP